MPTSRVNNSRVRVNAVIATLLLLIVGLPTAQAVTLDIDANTNSVIEFNGANDTFYFVNDNCCDDFQITTVTGGVADSIGLTGTIEGVFTIGAIATNGNVQTAPVSSSNGKLTIKSGSGNLTGDLVFEDIATIGQGGVIQTVGTANLTNISYTGSVGDLLALASAGAANQTMTFQFSPARSLTQLTADQDINRTSYSGTISAVPIPAAAWMFGSALIGGAMIGRRKKLESQKGASV